MLTHPNWIPVHQLLQSYNYHTMKTILRIAFTEYFFYKKLYMA